MSNMLDHLSIGNRIRLTRKLLNKTQTDLGDYLGIDRRAVSEIEQGKPCSVNRYNKIADFLCLDLDYLLYGENELVKNLYTVMLMQTSELISDPALSIQIIIDKYKSIIDYFENELKKIK